MLIANEDIQVLTKMGLTFRQAKIYLVLIRSGLTTAKTLAALSNVAKQDVYQTILALYEKGLVEKTVTKPAKFKAIPVKNAIEILRKLERKKAAETNKEAKKLIDKFNASNGRVATQEQQPKYSIISKREFYFNSHRIISITKTSFDIVDLAKNFRTVAATYLDEIIRTTQRGVRYRVLTESAPQELLPAKLQSLVEEGLIEIRYAGKPPEIAIAIVDKEKTFLGPLKGSDLNEEILYSTSPTLLITLQMLFDLMWSNAKEATWATKTVRLVAN